MCESLNLGEKRLVDFNWDCIPESASELNKAKSLSKLLESRTKAQSQVMLVKIYDTHGKIGCKSVRRRT